MQNPVLSSSQPAENIHFENGLIQDDFLKPYGLAINPVYKLYICTSCPTALTKSSCRRHLKDQHSISMTQAIEDGIDEISEMHDIGTDYPVVDLSEGPIACIAGLSIDIKSGCPLCMYTAGLKRVQKHIRENHPDSGCVALTDVSSQVLNAGAAPTNIRIIPPTPLTEGIEDVKTIAMDYESFNLEAFAPVMPSDNRMIAPWLLRTGFHHYTEGYDTQKLIQLCSLPSTLECKGYLGDVQKLVLEYMNFGTDLIKETDPLVLQMLNTAEPEKE